MISRLVILFLFMRFTNSQTLIFYGFYEIFDQGFLNLSGAANYASGGVLQLTSKQSAATQQIGHCLSSFPFHFKKLSQDKTTVSSFSTTFVFAIIPSGDDITGDGLAFVVTQANEIPGGDSPPQYLGLFNTSTNGKASSHVLAVEFDTVLNPEFEDINNNHVGIDINSLTSLKSSPAGYFKDITGSFESVRLGSGKPMQAWVEYDGMKKQLEVTVVPFGMQKPNLPLLSLALDLSDVFLDFMYVGFSAATGSQRTTHQLYGWTFTTVGSASPLDNIKLLPGLLQYPKKRSKLLTIWIPLLAAVLALGTVSGTILIVRSKIKFAQIYEDRGRKTNSNIVKQYHAIIQEMR